MRVLTAALASPLIKGKKGLEALTWPFSLA